MILITGSVKVKELLSTCNWYNTASPISVQLNQGESSVITTSEGGGVTLPGMSNVGAEGAVVSTVNDVFILHEPQLLAASLARTRQ